MTDTVLLKMEGEEKEKKGKEKKKNTETSQIPKRERRENTHWHSRLCSHY